MVIQHQQTLLYVTKSANGPKLPNCENNRDQKSQFAEVSGIKNETLSLLPQYIWLRNARLEQMLQIILSFQVSATEPRFVSRSPSIHANRTFGSFHINLHQAKPLSLSVHPSFAPTINNRTQLKHANPRQRFVPIPLIIPQGESPFPVRLLFSLYIRFKPFRSKSQHPNPSSLSVFLSFVPRQQTNPIIDSLQFHRLYPNEKHSKRAFIGKNFTAILTFLLTNVHPN